VSIDSSEQMQFVCPGHNSQQTKNSDEYETRYDMMQEFNMDWKPECGQLNLALVTKNKNI